MRPLCVLDMKFFSGIYDKIRIMKYAARRCNFCYTDNIKVNISIIHGTAANKKPPEMINRNIISNLCANAIFAIN